MPQTSMGVGLFGTEPAPRSLQLAARADQLGYRHCWIGDSQNIWRESTAILGAAATQTEQIILGTGVTNAVTRHLSVLASGWATLSELAEGRVALGIGTGDSSLRTMGMEPIRLAKLEERVTQIRKLFAGDEVTEESTGAAFKLSWVTPGHIPIYVAASGPKILELAGRIADGVIMLVGTDPRLVTAALERVEVGAKASGRDLDDLDIVLWTPTAISEDATAAHDLVRAHVARVLIRPLTTELDGATMARVEKIRQGYDYYQHMETGAGHAELVPGELLTSFALAGTIPQCRAQIQALADLPINEIAIIPYTETGQDRDTVLDVFAREVMQSKTLHS